MNFRLFLELFGGFGYHFPDDKRQQMYDFYMLQMLYGRANSKYSKLNQAGVMASGGPNFRDMDHDDKIDYMIQEVAHILVPALKQSLLDVVYSVIVSEMSHAPSAVGNFDQNVQSMGSHQRSQLDAFGKDSPRDPFSFVRLARQVFSNWRPQWALIAEAWMKLYRAKGIPEQMVYIDHIYDIQHNNGTVFNRSDSFSVGGSYRWIEDALDHKSRIRSPHELLPHVSPAMRRLALPAIKAKFGTSLEDHKEQSSQIRREFARTIQRMDGGDGSLEDLPTIRAAKALYRKFNYDSPRSLLDFLGVDYYIPAIRSEDEFEADLVNIYRRSQKQQLLPEYANQQIADKFGMLSDQVWSAAASGDVSKLKEVLPYSEEALWGIIALVQASTSELSDSNKSLYNLFLKIMTVPMDVPLFTNEHAYRLAKYIIKNPPEDVEDFISRIGEASGFPDLKKPEFYRSVMDEISKIQNEVAEEDLTP